MLLLFLAMQAIGQEKKALIIAIGDYDFKTTHWAPISSANDVPIITSALIAQGFKMENISLLQDHEATKAGIQNVLVEFTSRIQSGDIVYVHYSGHGQQIQDDNGDEIDGYDEALIPIDAHLRFQEGLYEGENHFRDDEFGKYLERIRQRAGSSGNVLVVIDACHSGTATRGEGKTRGTAIRFEAPGYQPDPSNEDSGTFGLYIEKEGLAPMVSFFGSASDQLNYEYRKEDKTYVGSLSYAFAKSLTDADPSTTYQGLFDRIRIEMARIAPRQVPQAEGTLDQQILGGQILGRPDYAQVITFYDPENITVNKGLLHGLNVGSKVGFYDIDVRDYLSTAPKATGTITLSEMINADVKLDNPLEEAQAKASWIFITEQNYGNMYVNVKQDISNSELASALNASFKRTPLIKLTASAPDILVDENNKFTRGTNLLISTADDIELWSTPSEGERSYAILADKAVERIIQFAQARYIKNLEVHNADLTTKTEIIPIEVERMGRRVIEKAALPIEHKLDTSGNIVFRESDYFKLRITNQGTKTLFFTVLDIQPDDKINVLLPPQGRAPQEFRLDPGRSYESPPIELFPPYGLEVMKIVASDIPIDLGPVLRSRGEDIAHRGPAANPFQRLFAESFKPEGTRGAQTSNLPMGSVNIESMVFIISKK